MILISNVRYNFVKSKIIDFLKNNNSDLDYTFPVDVLSFLENIENCKVLTYREFAKKYNINMESVADMCISHTGCTHYDPSTQKYLVLYNNYANDYNMGRVTWTLAHELAHIVLGHLSEIGENSIPENGTSINCNQWLETEADFFAATLLAPFQLFGSFNIQSANDIQYVFGLSQQAALIRWENYLQWKSHHFKTSFDTEILKIHNKYS